MIRVCCQRFREVDPGQARRVRFRQAAHWAFSLLVVGLVLTGCENSPGARKKKKEERWLKGRVFAEVYILESPRRIIFKNSNEPALDFDRYRQSQGRLMTSQFVLQAALRKPEVASVSLLKEQSKPLEWLEKNLVVDFPAREFIRISMKSDQRADAATIVNAVVNAYLEEVDGREKEHRTKRYRELSKALDELRQKVKVKANRLRRLVDEVSGQHLKNISPQVQASVKFRELAVDELAREELAQAKDQVQVAVLKSASKPQGDSSDVPPTATELTWLETSMNERSIRIEEWRRILDAGTTPRQPPEIHSLERKHMEREMEGDMALMSQIGDELTRLELDDEPDARITLFRKATADDEP